MAHAPVFKGQTCKWGTEDVNSPCGGIVVDANVEAQGQTDAVEDENGARIGIVIYDQVYSGTITVVCKGGETLPEVGTAVKVGNFTCYVTGARTQWQNKGKKQIVVTVEGGKYV
jgi:hypothetical protein